jgi:hypothetical protein
MDTDLDYNAGVCARYVFVHSHSKTQKSSQEQNWTSIADDHNFYIYEPNNPKVARSNRKYPLKHYGSPIFYSILYMVVQQIEH